MRPSNKSRSRNKTGNNGNHNNNNNNNNNNNQRRNNMGNIINRVFESAGPDGKVRGTPQQIIDKYQALARDAQLAGDRVAAESYLQHSEHYSRILGEAQRAQQEARASQERDGDREDGGFEQRRQPQQQQPNMASGLTMIDTDDSFDSGPIETPEGRRGYEENGFQRRDREPRMNGHAQPAAQPAPEAAAPQPDFVPTPPAFEPAPQFAVAAAPEPVAEPVPASDAAPQEELQLAEPQAEPVKKPRARRRKTQPAVSATDDASAPQPEPEPAPSE
ncbi:MAG: DUF4167 domain-containing protein [Amaricoccus sp.]|uniref:DUF4167 domain-containing protein n=1 Tax=Amaricoccus sp. TaxID=1872485 RepID=UPI0039E55ECE